MITRLLTLVGIALVACRPMPEGDPRYPVYEPFANSDGLAGPFPYEPGDERLAFGLFYEGGFSEVSRSTARSRTTSSTRTPTSTCPATTASRGWSPPSSR